METISLLSETVHYMFGNHRLVGMGRGYPSEAGLSNSTSSPNCFLRKDTLVLRLIERKCSVYIFPEVNLTFQNLTSSKVSMWFISFKINSMAKESVEIWSFITFLSNIRTMCHKEIYVPGKVCFPNCQVLFLLFYYDDFNENDS